MTREEPPAELGDLWYFAYGSNLDPDTFLRRRGMRPHDARLALLRGFQLVFDLPVGRGERGVANLLEARDRRVHGVAYEITHAQSLHLDRTEGVPRAYRRLEVELETADGAVAAFTYVSPHRAEGRKPSRRYLRLLLRGARHHGLPPDYLAELERVELARDERQRQLELFGDPVA